MRRIKKHQFEAVSLLTVDKGLLEVTVIPAEDQPDWIVPSSLILSVDDYNERIWTYLWHSQEVAVYQLIPKEATPDKIIVLEGNTDVHRIGLQTRGALKHLQVSISEVQDIASPKERRATVDADSVSASDDVTDDTNDNVTYDDATYHVDMSNDHHKRDDISDVIDDNDAKDDSEVTDDSDAKEEQLADTHQSEDEHKLESQSAPVTYAGEFQGRTLAYLYQMVKIDGVTYMVPDLDELAHRLVDLDS